MRSGVFSADDGHGVDHSGHGEGVRGALSGHVVRLGQTERVEVEAQLTDARRRVTVHGESVGGRRIKT